MRVLTKEQLHKLYLAGCAALITHGTIFFMISDGQFHPHRFMYYTVLSNLLVAVGFMFMLATCGSKSQVRGYVSIGFLLPITTIGLVYNLVLVPFGGASMILSSYTNFLTHSLSMALALVNYFAFEKKGLLKYSLIPAGLAFTFVYWVVFVSIGPIIDFALYFFMRPNEIGWHMVFAWLFLLLIVLGAKGFLLVWFDRRRGKRAAPSARF